MTNLDARQQEYNKYEEFPHLSYNCIAYLIANNEILWKLLNYNSSNALSQPNLSRTQKAALIYNGQSDEFATSRVFLDEGQDNPVTGEISFVRIFPYVLEPINYKYGQIVMCFEIFSHYKINHLSNYTVRVDSIVQTLLETLNGADITGMGRLFFDKSANRMNTAKTIGIAPFKGKVLMIGNTALG
jgi:hypothetical protein